MYDCGRAEVKGGKSDMHKEKDNDKQEHHYQSLFSFSNDGFLK